MFFTFLYCAVFSPVSAILGPGYEDELFCEDTHCMRGKSQRPVMAGSITLFHECVHREDGTVKGVETWGSNEGPENREKLLGAGYHSRKCSEEEQDASELHPPIQSSYPSIAEMFQEFLEYMGYSHE